MSNWVSLALFMSELKSFFCFLLFEIILAKTGYVSVSLKNEGIRKGHMLFHRVCDLRGGGCRGRGRCWRRGEVEAGDDQLRRPLKGAA